MNFHNISIPCKMNDVYRNWQSTFCNWKTAKLAEIVIRHNLTQGIELGSPGFMSSVIIRPPTLHQVHSSSYFYPETSSGHSFLGFWCCNMMETKIPCLSNKRMFKHFFSLKNKTKKNNYIFFVTLLQLRFMKQQT